MSEPKRIRKKTNMTLSGLVKKQGPKLARARGMNFSQFVERLVREELIRAGKLPPEKSEDSHNDSENASKRSGKQ